MGRKKLILELSNKRSDDESDDYSSDTDSDEELQNAFAKGEIKPGLNGIVAFKSTERNINDKNGIKEKLNQMTLDLDWIERLDLICSPAEVTPQLQHLYGDLDLKVNKKGEMSAEEVESGDKADNEFKREMLFYRRAQSGVLEGIPRLKQLGVTTKRPDDYFAEMAKTDDHMKKVRETIVRRKTAIESSEKAKKLRELRKYGKQIQNEVLIKRQKEKKEMFEKIKRYKKGKQENLDFLDFDAQRGSDKNKNSNQNKGKKAMNKNQKQKYKDSKFGYGGQKKRSKYNTSNSSADMSKFSAKRHSKPTKGKQRPGKSKRQNLKNRRK